MESLFGDMIAKDEKRKLNDTFDLYETMISIACSVFFSTVYVMIVPFVSIYTNRIEDVNYIRYEFAFLITTAAVLYCLRHPYILTITAAGHFSQTRWGAYGEAIINITISVILVWKMGLDGVAVGTVIAISARFIYSVVYLSKNILSRPIQSFVRRGAVNTVNIGCIVFGCRFIVQRLEIFNYLQWSCYAGIVFLISTATTLIINLIAYKDTTIKAYKTIISRK